MRKPIARPHVWERKRAPAAIEGAAPPAAIDFGTGRSAMARTFPPIAASAMNTLTIGPQAAVGVEKVIARALDLVPALAAGKCAESLLTGARAYPPPVGSVTVPAFVAGAIDSPKYKFDGPVNVTAPNSRS